MNEFLFHQQLDHFQPAPILSNEEEGEGGVVTIKKKKTELPRRYKVLLHNDDYTTMEFVIHVLKRHFHKTDAEAQELMLKVHHEGVAVCGVYTYEVSETKVHKVTKEAEEEGHPLLCTMEPE